MDAFVHASGDGFGNTAPLRSDTGAIDMDAISQVAHVTQGAGKLTRKEKKHAKREMKRRKKEAKKAEKEAKKTYSSIKSQLKDRDKELSDKMADARKKRDSAKDVVNYIGYNKMYQDGICEVEEGIADWEFNQNVPAIDAMREGNRVRKASERARKNGKGTRQVKKDKVLAYLTEHPEATNTEVAEKTGVSRPSVIKYRREYAPALPAPKGGKIVKDDGTKVDTVKIDGVKVDSFDGKVDVNFDVKVDSDFDTGFYTDADGKSAGRQSAQVENEAVKIASRPKNIDDRYKNTATSTAVADGDGMTGSGIPTREEVRSHFAEMGFAVDPDRFFDVNEGRGWRTNSGKPVDDWKKLAAVWDRNEHPKAATPPARTEPKANAVGKIPSVEEVMAKWGCDRETAQGYIDENMY